MRIVNVPETGQPSGQPAARTIRMSWEDLIIAIILTIIVAGLITKQLTIPEALAYLGVTSGGGVWGYLSASKSR